MAQLERPTVATPDRRELMTSIGDIRPQDHVRVTGVIRSKAAMAISGCPACRYTLADRTGEVDLLFLGRVLIAGLETGVTCIAEGRAAARDGSVVIWNPRYEVVAAAPSGGDTL
jgi:RecG-like helicase